MSFINRLLTRNYQLEDFYTSRSLDRFLHKSFSKGDIIQKSYEENMDAFSLIRRIIQSYVSVPVIVERKTSDGWESFEDSTLQPILDNPNPVKRYSWEDIEEMYLVYLLAGGNYYITGEQVNGLIQDLDVLPNNFVEIQSNDNFFTPNFKYDFQLGKSRRVYSQEEINHVKFFNPRRS